MSRHGADGDGANRDRLLAVAAALFRKRGYEATTTRELARLMGLQKASLYHHIGKKEDLLWEICSRTAVEARAVVQSAIGAETDAVARLRALIRAHLEVVLSNPDPHATAMLELRSLATARRTKAIAMRDEYQAIVEGVVTDAQTSGALRSDVSAHDLTLTLLSMLNWAPFWYRPNGPLTPQDVGRLMATLFLEGAMNRANGKANGTRRRTKGV